MAVHNSSMRTKRWMLGGHGEHGVCRSCDAVLSRHNDGFSVMAGKGLGPWYTVTNEDAAPLTVLAGRCESHGM